MFKELINYYMENSLITAVNGSDVKLLNILKFNYHHNSQSSNSLNSSILIIFNFILISC